MPSTTTYIARSRAITALYARWYLREPWLFKWSGMASIASAQVGIGIALAEMLDAPNGAVRSAAAGDRDVGLVELGVELYRRGLGLALIVPLALHDAATRPLLRNDLEVIKQANDAIFYDIGWAHVAYAVEGLGAVEANATAEREASLLEAFRMLDEGAHLMARPADYEAGAALIRQSAVAMLRHEQKVVLPPYFERMSDLGGVFASIAAALDFEGVPGLIGQPSFSSYFGPLAVLSGARSVTNTEHRWEWIEQNLLPIWARIDAAYGEGCAYHRQLVVIAEERPSFVQQTAGLMNRVYPALGLNFAPGADGAPRAGMPLAAEPA